MIVTLILSRKLLMAPKKFLAFALHARPAAEGTQKNVEGNRPCRAIVVQEKLVNVVTYIKEATQCGLLF
jgi:hypothetical protein